MENKLIQLIYISRSTFLSIGNGAKTQSEVVDILTQSKANNCKTNLVGMLFFGDGCFFECLEGKEKDIDELIEILKKDSRHKDLKVISRKEITGPAFSKWSMKYVPFDSSIKNLLTKNGYTRFDPYAFDEAMIAKVLKLFAAADDESEQEIAQARSDRKLSKWALCIPAVLITLYLIRILLNT